MFNFLILYYKIKNDKKIKFYTNSFIIVLVMIINIMVKIGMKIQCSHYF